MRDYPCFCGVCSRSHNYALTFEEFKMLAQLPGAFKQDGRLSMLCLDCEAVGL